MSTLRWIAMPALLIASAAHGQQSAQQSTSGGAAAAVPARRLWTVEASLGSVYDSNIDHDERYLRSYGAVAGLGGRWRNRPDDPTVTVEYETAMHSYSGTDRWNRVSHHFRGAYQREVGRWTLEAIADASLKGSSEDRSMRDEYSFLPRAELELDRMHRLRFTGAYRIKQEEDPERDAANRYLQAEFRQKLEGGRKWEVGYREEWNDARGERNRYTRRTASLEYTTPLGQGGLLALEAKYRSKRYPNREVELEDVEVPRHDHFWIPSVQWTQDLGRSLGLRAGYGYEVRTSNDPEKDFDAHLFSLTLVRSW